MYENQKDGNDIQRKYHMMTNFGSRDANQECLDLGGRVTAVETLTVFSISLSKIAY